MSKTKLQIKRTSVSGRLPNTSEPSNTSYIDAGELAINLTDEKIFSSNGTIAFEVGANLATITVSGNATINAIIANGSIGTNNQVLVSNGSGIYWSSVAGGGDTLTNVDFTPANSTLTITTTDTAISQTFNYANSTTPGFVQLIDSTSNSAANIAASANSVKVAFDAAGNSYSNATAFAANADNIASGTLNTDRLPATANISTAINVGANVNLSTSTINVGNSTVNSFITSNAASLGNTTITGFANISSTLASGNTTITGFINASSTGQFGGDVTITGIVEPKNQILMGAPNAYVRTFASGYSTTHTPTNPQEIGRITFTGNFQNITIIGEIRGATGASVGVTRFILDLRSNTLPSKSFTLFEEETTNLGRLIRVRVYEDTTTGLVVLAYSCPEQIQNIGWSLKIQERGDYNYFQQVSTLTSLNTVGLTEVSLTSTVRTMSGNFVVSGNLTINTSTLHVDATNNRVGVGTTTPQNPLDVTYSSSSTNLTTGPGTSVSTGIRVFNSNTTSNAYSYVDLRTNNGDVRLAGINRGTNLSDFVILTDNGSGLVEGMRITSAQNIGIGTTSPGFKLEVNGSFAATTKSFVIPHPTKKGKKLRYGSLEGPENGVYVRGETISRIIKLPQYWTKLVCADSITVHLTAKGEYQQLFVEKIDNNKVYIKNNLGAAINCFYTIYAERMDVEKLIVEY